MFAGRWQRVGACAALCRVAVLAGWLAGAATANAALWGAPQTVSHTHASVSALSAGMTATGTGVVSWDWEDDFFGTVHGGSYAYRRAGSPAYGKERALPADTRGVRPYGASRVVVATVSSQPRSPRATLKVRFGDLAGHFGVPQVVARRRDNVYGPSLAANARGDSVLIWQEDRRRLYVSLRRHGERFGPARRLASGRIRGFSAAVGPRGDVLVAWENEGRIRTRWKGRAARTFGPVDELRSQTTWYAAMQTAVTAGGRAWIAWTSQLQSEGGGPGDAYIQVARRTPEAQRFERALLLDSGSSAMTPTGVSLAAGPDGRATLAWGRLDALTTTVKAAKLGATGDPSISELARFASVRAGEASAGYGDDASTMVAWTQPADSAWTTAQVYASRSPAGGSWGAPELVSAGPQPFNVGVLYPTRSGPASVVFANRTDPGHAVVQVATRQP